MGVHLGPLALGGRNIPDGLAPRAGIRSDNVGNRVRAAVAELHGIDLEFQAGQRKILPNFRLVSLIIDAGMAWGIIFLFAYDFYTAAYAGYVYIVIQASIRFGVVGSLASAASFVLGLLGAYLFRIGLTMSGSAILGTHFGFL